MAIAMGPTASGPSIGSTIGAIVGRQPLPIYFALAFAISWGGALLAIGGPAGIPGTSEQTDRLAPLVISALVAGPTVAGLLLTGLVSGRAGYRELLARLLRWRVSVRWYAAALLTARLFIAGALLALSLLSPEFLPGILTTDDKASVLLVFIPAAIAAGVFEELGWTGFAIPTLRLRHGVLATGLIVGVLWGAWHLLLAAWLSGDPSGAFSLSLFLPHVLTYAAVFPAFRVLMVWVYDRTGSLPMAMLMHAGFTAGSGILRPVAIAGVPSSTYALVLAAAMWVVVAAAAVANGGRLTLAPLPATTRTPAPAEETARADARAA